MRLWTIQPEIAYEILQKNQIYKTDKSKIEPEFLSAYEWLSQELAKKQPRPNLDAYPIWAWYRYSWQSKKPDLRFSGYATKGTPCVCLELNVPDEIVLLSDMDAWCFVLNNFYLDPSKTEKKHDVNAAWFDSLSKEEQEIIKVNSWQKVFDISPLENDWVRRGCDVQGVFWELKPEYVKKVHHFIAR